jgi:hypothetical protein
MLFLGERIFARAKRAAELNSFVISRSSVRIRRVAPENPRKSSTFSQSIADIAVPTERRRASSRPPARGSPTHITRRHARSDQRRYQGATLTIRSSSTRLTTVIGTWKRVAATRRCGRKQVPAVCRGFGIAGARSGAPLRSLAAQFSLHQRSTAIDRTPTTLATSFGSASRNASSGVSFSASRAGS